MTGGLDIDAGHRRQHQVSEFVRDGEALTVSGMIRVHDDHGQRSASGRAHHRLDARHFLRQINGANLDALLLQKLAQIRHRIGAQLPIVAKRRRGRFGGIEPVRRYANVTPVFSATERM